MCIEGLPKYKPPLPCLLYIGSFCLALPVVFRKDYFLDRDLSLERCSMQYVLAVDGGNTKTVALVANLRGVIVGRGRSGGSDIYSHAATALHGVSAVDVALANIETAVKQALQAARIQTTMLAASVFNLAGADWPEDYKLFQSAMEERRLGHRIHIQNDALGILHAASRERVGVALVCGTGAATGARGHDGRVWHSSFWQKEQGSEHLSQQTIDAVFRAELGLEEPTTLTRRVLDFFGLPTVEDVLHTLTTRQKTSERTSPLKGLTLLLLDEAEAGDRVARHIVQRHGYALGDYAVVAARRVGLERRAFPLILAGGVFRHPTSLFADAITERVQSDVPLVQVRRVPFEPIMGVLFTALDLAGIEVNASLRSQVLSMHPGTAFFDTSGQ
jgi:N-acetylglucosamine kinase-like BadF-type ATPase